MMRRFSTSVALLLWIFWVPLCPLAGAGADSLQTAGSSVPADTLQATHSPKAEVSASDSLGSEQDRSAGMVRDLWIPLATVLAVGGVLLLLYTQRGN